MNKEPQLESLELTNIEFWNDLPWNWEVLLELLIHSMQDSKYRDENRKYWDRASCLFWICHLASTCKLQEVWKEIHWEKLISHGNILLHMVYFQGHLRHNACNFNIFKFERWKSSSSYYHSNILLGRGSAVIYGTGSFFSLI